MAGSLGAPAARCQAPRATAPRVTRGRLDHTVVGDRRLEAWTRGDGTRYRTGASRAQSLPLFARPPPSGAQPHGGALGERGGSAHWGAVFRAQSRLLVIKRLLWHTLSTVQQFVPYSAVNQPIHQDVRERIDNLLFFTDSLLDDLRNLLSVQLALASLRTNDVMRVLTVFSALFMPLTFIVGVYGMNFSHMPELAWRYGYPAVWALMLATIFGVYRWFRKKGWW